MNDDKPFLGIEIVAGEPVEEAKEERVENPGLCQNCHQRPGTETWVAEGGFIAWAHGAYAMWCKRCCLEAQIKYCSEAASRVPELKKALAELPPDD